MKSLNIPVDLFDTDEFIGSEAIDQATWLRLLRYCAVHETGGTIHNCLYWGELKWQSICHVSQGDVLRKSKLWRWEGENLIVWAYPLESEVTAKKRRLNGNKGGRPKKDVSRHEADKKPYGFSEENLMVSDKPGQSPKKPHGYSSENHMVSDKLDKEPAKPHGFFANNHVVSGANEPKTENHMVFEGDKTKNFSTHTLYQEHQEQEININHQEQSITQKHQEFGQPKDFLTEGGRKVLSGKDDLSNDNLFVPGGKPDHAGNRPVGPDASPGAGTMGNPCGGVQGPENGFLHALQKLLGPERFKLWFDGTRVAKEEFRLTIFAKNKFAADWIRSKFKREIEQTMKETIEPGVPWRVLADDSPPGTQGGEIETKSPAKPVLTFQPTKPLPAIEPPRNPGTDQRQGKTSVPDAKTSRGETPPQAPAGESVSDPEPVQSRERRENLDSMKIGNCFGGVKPIWQETNFPANDLFSFEPTRRLREQLSRYFDLEEPAERQTLCQIVYCVVELDMGKYLGGYLQKIDSGEVKNPSAYLRHFVLWCCRDRGLTLDQINRDGQKMGIGKGLAPPRARLPSKRF